MSNNVVTMRQLLECGVHFGHQTKRWCPKMKRYIFTSRNGIHVIDLQQTIKLIKKAHQVVKDLVKDGKTILFVGTKKQAQEAIQTEADRCGMPYVNHRWLGGTLTNNVTLQQSITRLKDFKRMEADGELAKLSNKEEAKILKKSSRLDFYLGGIQDMRILPGAVIIVDTKKEQIAVQEARRLNIPIIGIVDTNADPTEVEHPIPANDDAIRAIKLICSIMAQAVIEAKDEMAGGTQEEAVDSDQGDAASGQSSQASAKTEAKETVKSTATEKKETVKQDA